MKNGWGHSWTPKKRSNAEIKRNAQKSCIAEPRGTVIGAPPRGKTRKFGAPLSGTKTKKNERDEEGKTWFFQLEILTFFKLFSVSVDEISSYFWKYSLHLHSCVLSYCRSKIAYRNFEPMILVGSISAQITFFFLQQILCKKQKSPFL